MRAVSLHVFGRVQGVGFRWLTKMVADQLGVTGFVKNEFDGSGYIEAAG
ncbi:acylphosphatase, partial [Schleiferilactobacillus harbinensis]